MTNQQRFDWLLRLFQMTADEVKGAGVEEKLAFLKGRMISGSGIPCGGISDKELDRMIAINPEAVMLVGTKEEPTPWKREVAS